MTDTVTLTLAEAQSWVKSRIYRMHLGLAATERALLEERAMTAYLAQERDRLAAEVAILKAELGCCRHVQPHER